jgi:toxin YoeB
MNILFTKHAFADYVRWQAEDKKIASKINTLLQDIVRTPFQGLSKPEPLKMQFSGYWSRRMTQEHRLVYKVEQETIIVVQCRYHY